MTHEPNEGFALEVLARAAHESAGNDAPRLVEAIRAVGILLDWSSQVGNEPIDGFTALGLARVLERLADTTAHVTAPENVLRAIRDASALRALPPRRPRRISQIKKPRRSA